MSALFRPPNRKTAGRPSDTETIGARKSHVDVFLVPVDGDNARDAKRYAHGLRIIPVKTFQQALQALATLPRKS